MKSEVGAGRRRRDGGARYGFTVSLVDRQVLKARARKCGDMECWTAKGHGCGGHPDTPKRQTTRRCYDLTRWCVTIGGWRLSLKARASVGSEQRGEDSEDEENSDRRRSVSERQSLGEGTRVWRPTQTDVRLGLKAQVAQVLRGLC